ncbi:NADH-ubiquinone oxidoreductase subunit E family protein [Campylobacter sp. CNRCH_2013_0898h]|uniref:NADH-ubiquinone oxidoreductase subunit E family protein n=1 Tax=Campylobacter sp. CNRCH_2013_0898h TaxID=2911601 RepID=UPI0021E666EC|nr:NADH-ubiquinone oxidoreductase subunit E family protein [Campylobacter sp. CNRCH_2013_0898h]MCV3553288.1 NADH-ubiquinone oxidoreductase subunit E family protein [Campylobacter sp. CNRCH_2013_0898h]
MRRVDLRKSQDLFKDLEQIIQKAYMGEVLVVLFEIGDFSSVEKSFAFIKEQNCELLNSLKFNQVDWTIVFKKVGQ